MGSMEWLLGVQRAHGGCMEEYGMVARCVEGAHRVVARCTEGVQRGIEWLLGAWRGDMEQLLGAQRACRGV